jgi:adenosylcobinamide-GDP ribazoletransferase
MAWFSTVGLVLGASLYGLDIVISKRLPTPLCNGLLVLFLILITGALHLDGLADFCDGLGAGAHRSRALQIMKDSRVGSFGSMGVCMGLLLKIFALMALIHPHRGPALILFPTVGRWAAVLLAWGLPYARIEGGTGYSFVTNVGKLQVLWATLWMVASTALLLPRAGFLVLGVMTVCILGAGLFFKRRFGGITGDLLGATIEGAEILSIILMAIDL